MLLCTALSSRSRRTSRQPDQPQSNTDCPLQRWQYYPHFLTYVKFWRVSRPSWGCRQHMNCQPRHDAASDHQGPPWLYSCDPDRFVPGRAAGARLEHGAQLLAGHRSDQSDLRVTTQETEWQQRRQRVWWAGDCSDDRARVRDQRDHRVQHERQIHHPGVPRTSANKCK